MTNPVPLGLKAVILSSWQPTFHGIILALVTETPNTMATELDAAWEDFGTDNEKAAEEQKRRDAVDTQQLAIDSANHDKAKHAIRAAYETLGSKLTNKRCRVNRVKDSPAGMSGSMGETVGLEIIAPSLPRKVIFTTKVGNNGFITITLQEENGIRKPMEFGYTPEQVSVASMTVAFQTAFFAMRDSVLKSA